MYEFLGLLFLSLLLVFALMDVVNDISDRFIPVRNVVVSASSHDTNNTVTVMREGKQYELFDELLNAYEESDVVWDYVQGEEGVSWTTLTIPSDGSSIVIPVKQSPRYYLLVSGNRSSGIIEFGLSDGKTVTFDAFRDQDSTELIRVYPFQNDKTFLLVKTVVYALASAVILSVLLLIDYGLKNCELRLFKPLASYLNRRIGLMDFFVCWLFLFLLALFIYKVIGIPNYLQIGDELQYWNSLAVDSDGRWDVGRLAGYITFRGYWCYIPQTIARGAGKLCHIDPSILYFLMPSAGVSWLAVYIFPGIYNALTGNEAKKLHILPIILVFVTIWQDCLTCVCCDLMGVVFLLASFCFILRSFRYASWMDFVIAGVTGAVAISFRTANLYGVIALVTVEFVMWLRRRGDKKILIGLLSGVLAFVLMSLPQLQINMYRGHAGLLPYDSHDAWHGRSTTVDSSDYSLTTGNMGYPVRQVTDDQMLSMKDHVYNNDSPLEMDQLLDVFMDRPLETLMMMCKKIIIGFDKKSNIAYPIPGGDVPWRNTEGIMFSLLNYALLYAGIWALIKAGSVSKSEKRFAWIVFLSMVFPETFMKIEWRYVIAGYMLLYYYLTFHFAGPFIESEKNRKEVLQGSSFLIWSSVFSFLYLTCSFTLLS